MSDHRVSSPPICAPTRGIAAGRALALRFLGALLLLATSPVALAAHTELRWSRPADGDTLLSAPTEIRLRFSSPVEALYTGLTLLGPDGTPIALPQLSAADGQREFAVELPERMPAGSYTVQWRTVAADGHVIEGSFGFSVEAQPHDPAEVAPAPPPPTPVEPPAMPPTVPGFAAAESPLGVSVRFLHFAALLGLIGAVVFRLVILGRLPANPHPVPGSEVAATRTRRVAGIALGLLAVVIVGRLWLQSMALHGAENAWSSEHLTRMLGATVWGRAWLLQVGAALLVLLGLLIARTRDRPGPGWLLVLLGVLGLAAVPGLSGHAATVEGIAWVAVLNDALHVLGAGAWLGTLALLLLAGLPAVLRAGRTRAASVATLVNRFSPVALGAAALVVLTGVVNALLHFNAPAELWTTQYGRVLLLKLAVLLPVLGLGAYNWRVVRPSLGSEVATAQLQRSARAEISIGVVVVLVTAMLVALPRP
jgi:putative copper export protein/methionine-rich copper-binding protein CopC